MPFGGGTVTDPNAVELGSAAGGDLTGTYPSPTIGNLKVLTQHVGNGQITPGKLATGLTGLYLLFDSTLGADSTTGIDTGASGIAQTADNLIVYITARTDEAAVTSSCTIRLNGDSGANYDYQGVSDVNTTLAGIQALAATGWVLNITGGLAAANVAGYMTIHIPNYRNTSWHKTAYVSEYIPDAAAGNVLYRTRALRWRSTAAVNQLALVRTAGSNIKIASRLTVYGL